MAHKWRTSPARSVGKNDSRYWRSKIFQRVDPRGARSAHYTARIQWQGQRHYFALGTANKEAAAAKAAEIWRDLVSLGLEVTLAKQKCRPRSRPSLPLAIGLSPPQRVLTGQPATFGEYARSIAVHRERDSRSSKGSKRFGRSGPREEPIASRSMVLPWRRFRRKRSSRGEYSISAAPVIIRLRQRSARISCNSTLRLARSLFSRRILKFVDPKIVPAELPFAGVEFFSRESMRYQSKFDPVGAPCGGHRRVGPRRAEEFSCSRSASVLRRGEIDRLLWRQVDFDRELIRVEDTEAGALKTEDSTEAVQIDEELDTLLRGFRAKAKSEYVIEAANQTAVQPHTANGIAARRSSRG